MARQGRQLHLDTRRRWWGRAHVMERMRRHYLDLTDEFLVRYSGLGKEVGALLGRLVWLLLRHLVLLVSGGDDDLLLGGGFGHRGCLRARRSMVSAPRTTGRRA